MKKLVILLSILLGICILLFSSLIVVFDSGFYETNFVKYGAYDKFNESFVNGVSDNLINYFSFNSDLDSSYYTKEEYNHLIDVKNLIVLLEILLIIFLLLLILGINYLRDSKDLWIIFLVGFIFILLFSLFSLINFSGFFNIFHELFFIDGTWVFNSDSLLIQLFPFEFFISGFVRILLYSFLFGFISLVFAYLLKARFK